MSGAARAVELSRFAGDRIDLAGAPFTLPGSRVLVLAAEGGVRVCTSEYERPLGDCVVLDRLSVRGDDGAPLQVTDVLPHRIEFGDGAATLCFAGTSALSLGAAKPVVVDAASPDAPPRSVRLEPGQAVELTIAPDRSVRIAAGSPHAEQLETARREWGAWFERCPEVRPDLQEMTAFCWWVLGANGIDLEGLGRAVVPSKIGYVGLWQWDAYFIAVGLRHGSPALAREQLELAFRFPSADGQLPDVVHEHGVLASSEDLPPADRETLRRAGSAATDSVVPLTKPPLAAWALRKVLETEPADNWATRMLPIVQRSQEWWFEDSDSDGDGLPEYAHPYSSGLDDSPIFDGPLPTTSPDLAAYLVLQDLELAGMTQDPAEAQRHRARSARTLERLLGLWDEGAGCFRARAAGTPVDALTIVSLLPLVAGTLPPHIAGRLRDSLWDAARFGTPWAVPTVATRDPHFSAERMWRGPVWVNTNALLIEGLTASGFPDDAHELRERTLALVLRGGGPHEYFNPLTGQKAATATTSFGWSAALFVDLAVTASRRD